MIDQRAHRGYQSCAGVATKRVLQQSRDLGVTVANVVPVLALCKALDHFSKATQTQVDGLELEHVLLVHDFFFMNFLAACQVAQVQLASENLPSVVRAV